MLTEMELTIMFLAIREMKHAKFRYMLISFIMVLIVVLVLFVSGLANGLSEDNASSIKNLDADYLLLEDHSDQRLNRSVLNAEVLDRVQTQIANNQIAPLGVQMATLINEETDKKTDVAFFAIDTSTMLAPEIATGRMISNRAAGEAVADESLKDEGYKIGDFIKDQTTGVSFRIVGFTDNQSFSHSSVIHINFKDWKSISQTQKMAGAKNTDGLYNAIAIKANEKQAEKLQNSLSDIDVLTKDDVLKGVPGYEVEQGTLMMMVAFLFIIAAFVLAVFFYVITIQKINQFGILKAIGAKSAYLAKNIMMQVILLTAISLLIGISLAYGASLVLPSGMPYQLNGTLVIVCSILFLVVAILGSLVSLYQVMKIDALEAIGRAA